MITTSKKAKAGPVNADRLKSFVERIEKLEEERKAIGGDIKDVYSEAKGVGYDVGTMRKVIRLRGMDAADRAEQETLLDVYMHALGMVDRIDARLAAGESQRDVAEAEGVSKSTVQRRGPKTESIPSTSKTDHPDADSVITEDVEPWFPATPADECVEIRKAAGASTDDDMPPVPPFLRRAARTGT